LIKTGGDAAAPLSCSSGPVARRARASVRAHPSIKDRFKRYERYWPLEDRHAGDDLREAVGAHAPFVRGRDATSSAAPRSSFSTRDSQLGRGEPVEDAAQVVSRMCDVVMIRTFEQDIVERFARTRACR